MAYDEHDTPNAPGPVASAGFVQNVLRTFSLVVPPDKLVLGIGDYGYDWARDNSEPQTVTNAEAIAQAAGYRGQERRKTSSTSTAPHLSRPIPTPTNTVSATKSGFSMR